MLYKLLCKNSIEVPQKLETELLYDPATSSLYIYPIEKKLGSQKHVSTPKFIEPFITAKMW